MSPNGRNTSSDGSRRPLSGLEMKRMETEAAVAQMKERLRFMGLLDGTKRHSESDLVTVDEAESPRPHRRDVPLPPFLEEKVISPHSEMATETFFPPPPPTSSSADGDTSRLKREEITTKLRKKASDYRKVLRCLITQY